MLEAYEEVRRVDVARIQNAARNAMEWFEVVGTRYADTLEPEQFMYSMLTRSQRISHENLRLRDKDWLEGYERWFAERAGAPAQPNGRPIPPMFTPYRARGLTLANRVIVSPMAMYWPGMACRTTSTWSISAHAPWAVPRLSSRK